MRSLRDRLMPGKRQLAVLALLIATPLGVATARQLTPAATSPATGHAQVVTQGIAELPSEPLIWRVVERTAQPRWEAKAGERVLGFILASDEPVLLTNIDAEGNELDVARLGAGEAFLVADGTRQIRASMSDQPTTYLSLEIVPAADADKVGNGTVLYTSPAFTPPSGQRDIDLVRNVLRLRETATLPDTGGDSVYILATDGAIDILPSTGEATRLEAGESGIFSGPLEISAVQPAGANGGQLASADLTKMLFQEVDSGAGYVVAVIGEEIPPVQTPTPIPSPTAEPTNSPEPTVEQPTVASEPSSAPTEEPTLEPTEDAKPSDSDGDGLEDIWEREYGGDPGNPDTDGDGLLDGQEVYGYQTGVANRDSDQDGLSDGDEVNRYGTSPTTPDTDGDRLTDGREVAAGTDPLDPKDPSNEIEGGE